MQRLDKISAVRFIQARRFHHDRPRAAMIQKLDKQVWGHNFIGLKLYGFNSKSHTTQYKKEIN